MHPNIFSHLVYVFIYGFNNRNQSNKKLLRFIYTLRVTCLCEISLDIKRIGIILIKNVIAQSKTIFSIQLHPNKSNNRISTERKTTQLTVVKEISRICKQQPTLSNQHVSGITFLSLPALSVFGRSLSQKMGNYQLVLDR